MLSIHWFLPTGGDSRDVVPSGPEPHVRAPSLDYLTQVARAAEQVGFDAALTPCGTACEDAWLSTSMLVGRTERLRYLVAFRPGLLSPTLAAQMASTYQRMSSGRLALNIVVGAEPTELARFGDFTEKDERYRRAGEFLAVLRGALSGEPFDFQGEHYGVTGSTTREAPEVAPPIFFGGASPVAEEVAAQWVDVYLAWGEPPAMVAERLDRMRERAAAHGRELSFGIRFHVITRPTSDDAWAAASRLLAGMDPEAVAAAKADFATTASVGQQRMAALHDPDAPIDPSDPKRYEIYPNLWSGVGMVRGGAGTAIVGSHTEVADRIAEYADLGFDHFILSGYPHLEEVYWCGEGVLPILRRRGLVAELPGAAGLRSAAAASTFR